MAKYNIKQWFITPSTVKIYYNIADTFEPFDVRYTVTYKINIVFCSWAYCNEDLVLKFIFQSNTN